MAYRTAEQDERLNKLYAERERIMDYAAEHRGVDVSLALGGVDDEILFLTEGIEEMACPKCSPKPLNEMTPDEQEVWFAGVKPIGI